MSSEKSLQAPRSSQDLAHPSFVLYSINLVTMVLQGTVRANAVGGVPIRRDQKG